MINSSNLHRVIKGEEALGNIPKSPYGWAYMVRERISKYIEDMKEIILLKLP